MKKLYVAAALTAALSLSGCAGNRVAPKDYAAFRAQAPRSILIAPVINHSRAVSTRSDSTGIPFVAAL